MDTAPAARLNAHWCDSVVRSYQVCAETFRDRWVTRRRAPLGYPDAITLSPGLDPSTLLSGTDPGPGLSVKDSFADVNLEEDGLSILFTASWIYAEPCKKPAALAWQKVDDYAGFARWARVSRNRTIPQQLLNSKAVTLWVVHKNDLVSAAVWFNQSGDSLGVSNVLIVDEDALTVWVDIPRLAAITGSGPIWGYEKDPRRTAAEDAGFITAGPLRVWLRP